MRLRILSRSSELARIQARLVGTALQANFPDVEVSYDTRASAGDRDPDAPLASLPDKGAFTADLSSALSSGAADLVVHSWKDLPLELPAGNVIGATLERADPRDVLLVRGDVVAAHPPVLRVLSSSPRRAWLLQDVLPGLLPWPASVEMCDVRGNVPTRIAKLLAGHGDALVVAKAALDRLQGLFGVRPWSDPGRPHGVRPWSDPGLTPAPPGVRPWSDPNPAPNPAPGLTLAWMVLPIKDVPTAPAQGALAVEVSAGNTAVRRWLDQISHRATWDAVSAERGILARYGGGCHQALGATVLPRSYGTITSVRARTADGCVTQWSLTAGERGLPRTSARYVWPRPDERGTARRTPIAIAPPPGTPDLWVSRSEALPEAWPIDPRQLVWAAGSTTWRRLAARGVWVNGCADGLGDDEDPNVHMLAGRTPRWLRLTHADGVCGARCAVRAAQSEGSDAIATYAVETTLPEDLPERTHFFWTSGSLFREALARCPGIASRWHASGPGRTSRVIRDTLGDGNSRIFLDYDQWFQEIVE